MDWTAGNLFALLGKRVIIVKHKIAKKQEWVYFFIHKPIISIAFVIILVASAYYIIPKLPSGFLPQMDEGSLVLDFASPPGTSLENTDKMLDSC